MRFRLVAAAAALVLTAAALSGCAGEPEPTEPTPAFTSEAEAFAAAEETYRAYVDALNARRTDPRSKPDPQDFLLGDALEVDIETQRQLDQAGLSLIGPSEIADLAGVSTSLTTGIVAISVCLDSSNTRVANEEGEDVTPVDRVTRTPLRVELRPVGKDLVITRSELVDGGSC